jgi:hypothetical protein
MKQNVTNTTLSIDNLEKVIGYESFEKMMFTKAWEENDSYVFQFMDGRFPPVIDGLIKLYKKRNIEGTYDVVINDGSSLVHHTISHSDIQEKFKFISKISKMRSKK